MAEIFLMTFICGDTQVGSAKEEEYWHCGHCGKSKRVIRAIPLQVIGNQLRATPKKPSIIGIGAVKKTARTALLSG